MEKVMFSWSGGKDSAFALYKLMEEGKYEICGLFSTTSEESDRLPAHEVHSQLIGEQAKSIQLPFYELKLPNRPSNAEYEQKVGEQFKKFKAMGITTIVYADLLLEDMRAYRDQLLARYGMKGLYPLWKKDTLQAAEDFIKAGFQAIVTTVAADKLNEEMVGKEFDTTFLQALPEHVDPSGENGEFHTFVYDGPIFHYPIDVLPTTHRFETEAFGSRFLHIELAAKENKSSDQE